MRKLSLFYCPLIAWLIFIPTVPLFAEETLIEVRFRGNFTISDETMLQMAGIKVGLPVNDLAPEEIRQKLLAANRFEWVEVTKRYRSISRNDEVVLVVTVKEKEPAKDKFMYFPILSGSDEYGITYGFRTTAKDLLGLDERISIPLTWGGVRRAAIEGEFNLHNPVAQSLTTTVGVSRKENPHYKIGDFRKEVHANVKRRLKLFEANVHSGWTDVDFGNQEGDFVTVGAGLVFDTRQDVNLPRDAVYTDIGWKRLSFLGDGHGTNIHTVDLRGYKGIFGQAVLAGQIYYSGTDEALPDYERPFLGGATTLRGHEPGAFIGDNIATASLELRLPLNSLRSPYRAGIDIFLDSGTVYDHGKSIGNAKFRHGTGVGAFFLIMGFGVKVDVAYNTHDAFRVHFSTGFRF